METHNINDKPAFPNDYHPNNDPRSIGMSKRFYAACAAMQGICADPNVKLDENGCVTVAKMAYRVADELLSQENE